MADLKRAKQSFRFFTRLHLSELTGLRASTVDELLELIKKVPGSSIYHHTHHFLQQHQYLSPEPPNDFAYWVSEVLGENALGEMLASIDTIQFSSIRSLRNRIAETIETYLEGNPSARRRFAGPGDEFYFVKSVSFVIPTSHVVHDLAGFSDVLERIAIDSVYFHLFEARLRLERATNDFSLWLDSSLGEKELADEIARLDPYTCTLEALRARVVKLVKNRMGNK